MKTAKQIDREMAERPPEAPTAPAEAAPGQRGRSRVGQALAGTALGLGMRLKSDEEVDLEERTARSSDALKLRDRLPEALREPRSLGHCCDAAILLAAKAWRPSSGNLLLLAETGAGKSTAAAFIMQRLISIGVHHGGERWALAKRSQWFHALELQAERLEHGRNTGTTPPRIAAACGASVLVLDDVGQERRGYTDVVEEVISRRYDRALPTVITSNLSYPAGLGGFYREAIVRKMTEQGGRAAVIVDLCPKEARSA